MAARYILHPVLLAVALALVPTVARAEWQVKPFAGVKFGGSTTYILNGEAGKKKPTLGASVLWQGDVVGVEADLGHTPSYFNDDSPLILKSRVTTLTANLVLALPKKLAQYSLRPYVVAGGGLLDVKVQDSAAALPLSAGLKVMDVGAGATGFLSDHVGVNWDVRMFRSFGGEAGMTAIHPDGALALSLWRITMGLTIRP